MTTYILGAGASVHAGYPLTKALWSRLVAYTHSEIASNTMLRAIETISALYGPVSDIETMLTAVDRGDAGFQDLTAEERGRVAGGVRGTIAALFHYIRLENRRKD